MNSLNADRFRPGFEDLRELEQRLTSLFPPVPAMLPTPPSSRRDAQHDRDDARLDAALRDTFPASDPVAISRIRQ
jgi:hypothetical protein